MSYWTKRRKINAQVDDHLRNIESNAHRNAYEGFDCSALPEALPHQHISGENKNVDEPLHVLNITDSNEDDSAGIDEGNFEMYCAQYEESDDESVTENEQSCKENDRDTNIVLLNSLTHWATKQQITQSALKELLVILRQYHPLLPLDPRTLLKVKTKVHDIKAIGEGSYYHFGIANGIRRQLLSCRNIRENDTIGLQINVDGLPLFKSSNTQFWPILGLICGTEKTKPFVIGLFSGPSKPASVEEFFSDFIQEMSELKETGLIYNEQVYKISISSFICDAPARSYIKCIKGHSGYSGCDKCTQHGVYENKMTFPETEAPLRTDIAFNEMEDEDHHNASTPLTQLGIGMVSRFPLDYMHLVCLGVTKKLIWLWLKGPLTTRIGSNTKNLISEILLSLSAYIPQEFVRKPRSLDEVERWKATEFRMFLFYTGMVALSGKVHKEIYQNFICS